MVAIDADGGQIADPGEAAGRLDLAAETGEDGIALLSGGMETRIWVAAASAALTLSSAAVPSKDRRVTRGSWEPSTSRRVADDALESLAEQRDETRKRNSRGRR